MRTDRRNKRDHRQQHERHQPDPLSRHFDRVDREASQFDTLAGQVRHGRLGTCEPPIGPPVGMGMLDQDIGKARHRPGSTRVPPLHRCGCRRHALRAPTVAHHAHRHAGQCRMGGPSCQPEKCPECVKLLRTSVLGATSPTDSSCYFRSSTARATKLTSVAVPSGLRVSATPSAIRWSAAAFEKVFCSNAPSRRAAAPRESVGTKKA